jgi:predicted AlkP superfamily phosphohydrolase/phosphomutase
MRYLRMLSNSVFAGLLAAVYLSVLLLDLNPEVRVTLRTFGALLIIAVLAYGLHIGVLSYALYVLRQITMVEPPSSPGWISLRLLTWSAATLSATATVVTWLHASRLRASLDPAAIGTLTSTAVLWAIATLLFLILGFAQVDAHRRDAQIDARRQHSATVAVLFTLVTIVSIVGPLAIRGRAVMMQPQTRSSPVPTAPPVDGPRVLMLCLDGASLDVISPAVAAGRLPNFARILERGASLHLATARPTQAEPVWASVMTGIWPARHAVRAASRYRPFNSDFSLEVLPDYLFSQALIRFGLLIEQPYSSESLRAQPLWKMTARYGIRSGIIGLPLTHPAEAPMGFIVSDRFHRRDDRSVLDAGPSVWPAALDDVARTAVSEVSKATTPLQLDLMPAAGERSSSVEADRIHQVLARELDAMEHVRLLAVRYSGLDAIGHYYLRYAQPAAFGDVSVDEQRRFGRVLDDYYSFVDGLVGDALARLGPDDLLIVVSGFGMEAQTPGKRLLERVVGDPRFSGTHERGPDGFLLAYGADVASGRQARGAIVDVAPTLLYFFGLPVARNMDGFARTDVFTRDFNAQRTITFIPSYD